MVKNPPAYAGDLVLRPDPGRFHVLQGNQAPTPQPLSLSVTTGEYPSLTASREKPACSDEDQEKKARGMADPWKIKKESVCGGLSFGGKLPVTRRIGDKRGACKGNRRGVLVEEECLPWDQEEG